MSNGGLLTSSDSSFLLQYAQQLIAIETQNAYEAGQPHVVERAIVRKDAATERWVCSVEPVTVASQQLWGMGDTPAEAAADFDWKWGHGNKPKPEARKDPA